ncbi:MAG: response regulator transcription factor [Rhodocyclaceae bacterium]
MKLLIVEDSNLVSVRLKLAFGQIAALDIVFADRIELGLERFRALQPELVILDIDLPDGNGMDLLQTIKHERPAARVMMFSNHDYFRQRCKDQGADYFFDKSEEFESLAVTVQALTAVCP